MIRMSLASFVVAAASLGAQSPRMVADVNAVPHPGIVVEERQTVTLGGWVYFVRDDPLFGSELFRMDPNGIGQLVRDLAPGEASATPSALTVVGSTLFFSADDGVHGRELWRTDGTPAGTALVLDANPGPGSGVPADAWWHRPFGVLGALVVFPGSATGGEAVLWRSDGTATGTFPLATGALRPAEFTTAGGRVFCRAGADLWVTDGTVAGTRSLFTFYGGCNDLAAVGGTLFFTAAGSWSRGYELWKSDGTVAGTVEVKDIHPGTSVGESSYPAALTDLGGVLLFSANDGVHGRELWRSDGTAAGTVLVRDVRPGSADGLPWYGRRPMAVQNGRVLFAADDGISGSEPWLSDGTTAGTVQLADLVPGPAPGLTHRAIETGAGIGGRFWFAAQTAGLGAELHVSDGTLAGTRRVADLWPGAGGSLPRAFAPLPGGGIAFAADAVGQGPAVFTSQGTLTTTLQRADRFLTAIDYTGSAAPLGLAELDGRLLFAANDGVTGHEPWVSDGTAAGTSRIADLKPGPLPSIWNGDPVAAYTHDWVTLRHGRHLYFMADPGNVPVHLHRTDGTPAGTSLVQSFQPYPSGGANMGYQLRGIVHRGAIYLMAFGPGGWGLYRGYGEPPQFARLRPIAGNYEAFQFAGAGDLVYLVAGWSGSGLWRSDGTQAGTFWLNPSQVMELAPLGRRLVFVGRDTTRGEELWITDGTAAGTVPLADVRPGTAGSSPRALTSFGDLVLFRADDGTSGEEPWVTDGTAAGTRRLADAWPGSTGSVPREFTVQGARAFFTALTPAGDALFRTDGTVAATVAVATFARPSTNARGIGALAAIGSRQVLFGGYQLATGLEPWVSDGTAAGTRPLGDLYPGSNWSQPQRAVLVDGDAYFTAEDGRHGFEVWKVHLGASSQVTGVGCAPRGQMPPRLWVGDPVLGGTADLLLRDAAPMTTGVLAFGPAAGPPLDLGEGCEVWVQVPVPVQSVFQTDAQGRWSLPALPVPNTPGLLGIRMSVQALTVAAGPAFALSLSNGVRLVFGR